MLLFFSYLFRWGIQETAGRICKFRNISSRICRRAYLGIQDCNAEDYAGSGETNSNCSGDDRDSSKLLKYVF
jgi:hypothetical protein